MSKADVSGRCHLRRTRTTRCRVGSSLLADLGLIARLILGKVVE
jgi:hypothetical protein